MNLFWVFLPPILLSVLWLFSSPLYKLDAIFNLFHGIVHIGFIFIQLIPICLTKTSSLFNSPYLSFLFHPSCAVGFSQNSLAFFSYETCKTFLIGWLDSMSDTAFRKSNETCRKQSLNNVYPLQKILTMMKFSKCPFFKKWISFWVN